MRVGIYDPYLDTLGGGEKFVLNIAKCLGYENEVFIFWDDESIKGKWKQRFNIELPNIQIVSNIFNNKSSFFQRISKTKEYDLIFFVSDGSIPILFSKKKILIFQYPIRNAGNGFINRLKLRNIDKILCYSNFVKNFLDDRGLKSIVLSPAVEKIPKTDMEKENIILNVGRFTKGANTKKQEVLIESFKKMCDAGLSDWKLLLIGSYLHSDEDLILNLKNSIRKYPISILTNIPNEKLIEYYQKAKIYWHATGFGEDLSIHPEKAEHFGISTVEAMSAGCVPIVFAGGGQKEIVNDRSDGFLWTKLSELIEKTNNVICNEKLRLEISKNAKESSSEFGEKIFCQRLRKIING